MIPTIAYIEKKFEEFNQQMFAGKLPKIPIVLTDARSFLGKCVYRIGKGKDGKKIYYDFKLRINTRVDLPENLVEDMLIHEMIHYYIGVNQLKDESSHGPLFIHIMNTINQRFGRNITVSFKGTKEQQEQFTDKKPHYHVVALIEFTDGKTAIKVLPRVMPSILRYYNAFSNTKDVRYVKLFMTNDIFFNRYPNSAALKAHYVDKNEVIAHINDAEVLICDGKCIKRTK